MGAGHAALYREGTSAVHCAPAEAKIVALVVFVVAVVAAPRDALWPYACFALVVAVVWRVAAVPPRWALPRMLIEVPFDEPSADLDPLARRDLAELLATLPTTLLVVTHDLSYAAQLCDRTVILDAGRVVADGPTASVLGDAALLAAHRLELPWGFRLPPG